MYPSEHLSYKSILIILWPSFLDLDVHNITNSVGSSSDKRDYFNLEIANFPFLYGHVPRSPSYDVYISQLIRFIRVCSNVSDFNYKNQC